MQTQKYSTRTQPAQRTDTTVFSVRTVIKLSVRLYSRHRVTRLLQKKKMQHVQRTDTAERYAPFVRRY